MLDLIAAEPVRIAVYGVAVALVAVLVALHYVTDANGALILTLCGSVLTAAAVIAETWRTQRTTLRRGDVDRAA